MVFSYSLLPDAWLSGLLDDEPQEGQEIRLVQYPEYGLADIAGKVVIQKHSLRQWCLRPDGLIVMANRPELALTVEGVIQPGAQIALLPHYNQPGGTNMWNMDGNERITLKQTPSYGLSVHNGKLSDGMDVILWGDPMGSATNTWTMAYGGGMSTTIPCKLKVSASRGDPSLWSSLTMKAPLDYQTGYLQVSQAKNRDHQSSWAYVRQYQDHEVASFVKEDSSMGFYLVQVDKRGKVMGYLSLEKETAVDERDGGYNSTYAYVTADRNKATSFQSQMAKGGEVLVSAGRHLSCAKFKDTPQDFGADWTYMYGHKDSDLGAVLLPQREVVPVKESWWKSMLRRYWKVGFLCCLLLSLIVLIWIIVAIVHAFQPADDEQQIQRPYNCQHKPQHMWSHTKSVWCCKHEAIACPTTAAPAAAPFIAPGVPSLPAPRPTAKDDCFTDVLNWQRDWTISKQNYCCETHGIACRAAMTTPAFDCQEGYHQWTELWSYRKKLWCCLHQERGCPATGQAQAPAAFDCAEGYGDYETWEETKKEWCCLHASVACHSESSGAQYDCDAGYESWLSGWSEGKKVWCCFHSGRACRDTKAQAYDCNAGVENWQVGWSNSKMDYCCRTSGMGCPEVAE